MDEMKKINYNWEKSVTDTQHWEGTLMWDPDSSPEAWEHFQRYYTVAHWDELKRYNIAEPVFFCYDHGKYLNVPMKKYNRLYALDIEAQPNKNGYYKACLRLGGDTDFNFNDDKYRDYIKNSEAAPEEQQAAFVLLDECRSMHYSLLNFSLMQTMGNLQQTKEEGLYNKKIDNYEHLDRLDTLLYLLNEYFQTGLAKREQSQIITRLHAGRNNIIALKECYLDTFSDIYDYCEKVYFIKITDDEKGNDNFVQRLVKSGSKLFSSIEDVVNYMKMAKEFWEIKRKYFESIG